MIFSFSGAGAVAAGAAAPLAPARRAAGSRAAGWRRGSGRGEQAAEQDEQSERAHPGMLPHSVSLR